MRWASRVLELTIAAMLTRSLFRQGRVADAMPFAEDLGQ